MNGGKSFRLAASVVLAALTLLLLAAPAFAASVSVPSASEPPITIPPIPILPQPIPKPQPQPIYIVAEGKAVRPRESIVCNARLYMAGKVLYISPKIGVIKVEKLLVTVGSQTYDLKGSGAVYGQRITLQGYNGGAFLYLQGEISSDGSITLRGILLVQPRIRPLSWAREVWQLELKGVVTSQPPIQPLA